MTLGELEELARETERIGAEAVALQRRLATLPTEHAAAVAAAEEAECTVAERRADHTRSRQALASAEAGGRRETVAAARREEVRAGDALRLAERRAEAARARATGLAEDAEAGREEARRLGERARELATALGERPALAESVCAGPGEDLESVARWATEARAALFVARGRLAAEREAVIRQANELGSAVLGEPLGAQSAALVARRVERLAGGEAQGL